MDAHFPLIAPDGPVVIECLCPTGVMASHASSAKPVFMAIINLIKNNQYNWVTSLFIY